MMRLFAISFTRHSVSHVLLFLNAIIAFIGIRLPDILDLSLLRFVFFFLFFLGFFAGLNSCLKLHKNLTLSLLFFIIAIFIHAFVYFYLPSFQSGIAFQNYVLQKTFVSNFAITQTRLYMMYPVLFVFPILSFYSHALNSKYTEKYISILGGILIFCSFLNLIVIFWQGLYSFSFMTEGSGSSIDHKRAPGLFLDSGESGVFCCLLSSLILVYLFRGISFIQKSPILFILPFFSFLACIFVDSRIVYTLLVLILILFWTSKLFHLIKYFLTKKNFANKIKYNPKFQTVFISISSIFIIFFLYFQRQNLILRYEKIDQPRTYHLQVMWLAIKEHFFTGTGLGSFHGNLFYYYPKLGKTEKIPLDLPTNLYFGLISELGVVGLCLILFCFYCFYWKIKCSIQRKNNLNEKTEKIFTITIILPIIFLSSLIVCFLVGYNLTLPAIALTTLYCLMTTEPKILKYFTHLTLFGGIYLILISIYNVEHAPRVPLFRWAENGKPQVPVDVQALPQPEGKTQAKKLYFSELLKKIQNSPAMDLEDNLKNGVWLKFNNEFLLFRRDNKIFVPKYDHFPRTIEISFISSNNKKISVEKKVISEKGWVTFEAPQDPELKNCYSQINKDHFCSYKIKIDKNIFSTDIFYIENNYLP